MRGAWRSPAMRGGLVCLLLLGAPYPGMACDRPGSLGIAREVRPLAIRENPASPRFDVPLAPREVVLTFDDGPVAGRTESVLEALRRECVKATFFVVGRRARERPDLVRKLREEGHTVGTHTFSHKDVSRMEPDAAIQDMEAGISAVGTALDRRPVLFRFPSWKRTEAADAWLVRNGQYAIYADVSPADWRGDPAPETFARLKDKLERRGRGVIVLHDVQAPTAELVGLLLTYLKQNGFRVVHMVDR